MSGFVYVMSNPSFVGSTLKIGMSERDPTVFRSEELYSTGVPQPFKVEYYAFVDSPKELEQKIHQLLDRYRRNSSREFFECDVSLAVETIRENATIKYEEIFVELDPVKIEAEKEAKKKLKEDAEENARAEEARISFLKDAELRDQYLDATTVILTEFNKTMWSAIRSGTMYNNIIRNVRDMVLVTPMLYNLFKGDANDRKPAEAEIFEEVKLYIKTRSSDLKFDLLIAPPSKYVWAASASVLNSKKYIQNVYKTYIATNNITTYQSIFNGSKIWDEIKYERIVPKKTNPSDK
jgi:hypothetical protein